MGCHFSYLGMIAHYYVQGYINSPAYDKGYLFPCLVSTDGTKLMNGGGVESDVHLLWTIQNSLCLV